MHCTLVYILYYFLIGLIMIIVHVITSTSSTAEDQKSDFSRYALIFGLNVYKIDLHFCFFQQDVCLLETIQASSKYQLMYRFECLRNWPSNSAINWNAVAREHNIDCCNGGQVVKEFAPISIAHMQSSTLRQVVTRSSKNIYLGVTCQSLPTHLLPPLTKKSNQ